MIRKNRRGDGFRSGLRCTACLAAAVLLLALSGATAWAGPDAEVLPPGVVVRKAPDSASAAVVDLPGGAQVAVVFTQRGPEGDWARIVSASGLDGFVPNQRLRALAALPAWRRVGAPGGAPTPEQPAEGIRIRLKRAGQIFLIPARFNGQVDTLLVLDTGASHVAISDTLAARLGITRFGSPQPALSANGVHYVRRTVIESLHVPDESGVSASAVEATVGDLAGFPPGVGGLLGQTFLRRFRVSIDAERLEVELKPVQPFTAGR